MLKQQKKTQEITWHEKSTQYSYYVITKLPQYHAFTTHLHLQTQANNSNHYPQVSQIILIVI